MWTKSEYFGEDRISSAKYKAGGASAVSRYRRNPNGFVPTISVGHIGTRADRGLHKSSKKKKVAIGFRRNSEPLVRLRQGRKGGILIGRRSENLSVVVAGDGDPESTSAKSGLDGLALKRRGIFLRGRGRGDDIVNV